MAIFHEVISLSNVSYTTGGIAVKVSKANAISNVYTVTATNGYLAEPVSFSGQTVTIKFYENGTVAGAFPEVPATTAITANVGITYEGY